MINTKNRSTKTSGTRSILTQFQVINISVLKFKTFSSAKMTFCALSVFALRLQVMRPYNANQKHASLSHPKACAVFSTDNMTSQSPKIQSTFTPERPRFTLLVQKMRGKGFIYFILQHYTYFQDPKSKPKIETALLATKFLQTKQITDNMLNLHSPQHARLLGFDNVEEHQDSMKQVISALWKHNQAWVTKVTPL